MTTKAPKKKKGELPSKNIRVQLYLYTDEKGKRHYKSFVAPSRKIAQEMAARWKLDIKDKFFCLREPGNAVEICEKQVKKQ